MGRERDRDAIQKEWNLWISIHSVRREKRDIVNIKFLSNWQFLKHICIYYLSTFSLKTISVKFIVEFFFGTHCAPIRTNTGSRSVIAIPRPSPIHGQLWCILVRSAHCKIILYSFRESFIH